MCSDPAEPSEPTGDLARGGEIVPEVKEELESGRGDLVDFLATPSAGDMLVAGVEPPSPGVEDPFDIGTEPSGEGDFDTRRPKLSPVNNLSLKIVYKSQDYHNCKHNIKIKFIASKLALYFNFDFHLIQSSILLTFYKTNDSNDEPVVGFRFTRFRRRVTCGS